MGQIIDFHQRRVREESSSPAAPPTPPWCSARARYVETVLAPTVELWRLMVASYAGLWFAPFGLEVRPVERRDSPEPTARARSQR